MDLFFMHVSLLSYQLVTEGEGKQMHVLGLQYSKIAFWNIWPCVHQCSTLLSKMAPLFSKKSSQAL